MFFILFFFFKQKTAYEMLRSLVGSEMCIRDRPTGESVPFAAVRGAPTLTSEKGARLYERHCAQCHGKEAEGVPNAYPALAGNRAVTLPVTANLIQIVLNGGFSPATQGNPRPIGMPPFALVLSDQDMACLLLHISEPTRLLSISYAVFCLKKKRKKKKKIQINSHHT